MTLTSKYSHHYQICYQIFQTNYIPKSRKHRSKREAEKGEKEEKGSTEEE